MPACGCAVTAALRLGENVRRSVSIRGQPPLPLGVERPPHPSRDARPILLRQIASHTRSTPPAALRKVRVTSKSRARFRASFAVHHSARFFGNGACFGFGQPCQKQPSTNTAARSRRKTKSGLTTNVTPRRQSVYVSHVYPSKKRSRDRCDATGAVERGLFARRAAFSRGHVGCERAEDATRHARPILRRQIAFPHPHHAPARLVQGARRMGDSEKTSPPTTPPASLAPAHASASGSRASAITALRFAPVICLDWQPLPLRCFRLRLQSQV